MKNWRPTLKETYRRGEKEATEAHLDALLHGTGMEPPQWAIDLIARAFLKRPREDGCS